MHLRDYTWTGILLLVAVLNIIVAVMVYNSGGNLWWFNIIVAGFTGLVAVWQYKLEKEGRKC